MSAMRAGRKAQRVATGNGARRFHDHDIPTLRDASVGLHDVVFEAQGHTAQHAIVHIGSQQDGADGVERIVQLQGAADEHGVVVGQAPADLYRHGAKRLHVADVEPLRLELQAQCDADCALTRERLS